MRNFNSTGKLNEETTQESGYKPTLKVKVSGFEKNLLIKALDSYGHSVEAKRMIAKDYGINYIKRG